MRSWIIILDAVEELILLWASFGLLVRVIILITNNLLLLWSFSTVLSSQMSPEIGWDLGGVGAHWTVMVTLVALMLTPCRSLEHHVAVLAVHKTVTLFVI